MPFGFCTVIRLGTIWACHEQYSFIYNTKLLGIIQPGRVSCFIHITTCML